MTKYSFNWISGAKQYFTCRRFMFQSSCVKNIQEQVMIDICENF